ncbi:hypothetical protein AG1IA_01634 [Rhizoctonia solani AG-1 IA]|uniref:Uncharacterized protein n=1 Tax=Thanatephorus cucumeris (strain AG1-IA) TaxID=983506 RepID=L8X5H1_THACA|nr:hypothetical protein AG1IA_01634 [Rhizoctonia solani AG-1 IA]
MTNTAPQQYIIITPLDVSSNIGGRGSKNSQDGGSRTWPNPTALRCGLAKLVLILKRLFSAHLNLGDYLRVI